MLKFDIRIPIDANINDCIWTLTCHNSTAVKLIWCGRILLFVLQLVMQKSC